MSPKEVDGVVAWWRGSREVKLSHNAGDSASGLKCGLCGVGWANVVGRTEGDVVESIFDGGEKVVPLSSKEGDCGL